MNKKGQALVEFILVLPVLLIVLMSIMDIGNIYIKRHELNEDIEIVTEMYQNGKKEQMHAYIAREEIEFKEEKSSELIKLSLEKEVNINAPILSKIIGKKYKIESSKIIYGDTNE